jgi:hypothetical protein
MYALASASVPMADWSQPFDLLTSKREVSYDDMQSPSRAC